MNSGMELARRLQQVVEGEVRWDPISRAVYSVDASIFEVEPQVVVVARSREDVQAAVRIASEFGIPVVPRGAATGTTGGCLGEGIVIDLSKYMNGIHEIHVGERYVTCGPGVVLDRLNEVLAGHGFKVGPTLSTSNRATIGGMVANNASGQMADHLLGVEMVLANGEITHLEKEKQRIFEIAERNRAEILERFPKIPKHVSGYNLDRVLDGKIAPIIAGSEGTLGIITEVQLNIVPLPERTGLTLMPFESLMDAVKAVPKLLDSALSIEMIDRQIIELGRVSKTMQGRLGWLKGTPEALLIVERPIKQSEIVDPRVIADVWALRKAGLGLLMSRRTYSRAIGFMEDMAVPVEKLPSFLRSLTQLLKRHRCEAGIYGHVGEGCLHIRPFLDLRMQTQIDKMLRMMDEASDLVLRFGGSMSGEHGDGRIRSWLNGKMFGRKLEKAFRDVKAVFDPQNLMNPISEEFPRDELRSYPKEDFETVLHFDQGLPFAADMCNGNGACRNQKGQMCPSYHAHHDEYHTTRARAQALRTVMNGKPELFTSKELYNVLEYCVECKGCKTECPSQIDMAKMKSEFLYHYHKKHGVSLRDRMVANVSTLSRFGKPPRWLLNKLGFAPERPMPPFAKKRFSKSVPKQAPRQQKVVLFNDTFTQHNVPHVGRSAVQLFQKLGYEVIIPPYRCCGRPLISKGFLPKAKRYAERLIESLLPYAKEGIPIVGLEPSCLLTIRDDYPDLIDHTLNCYTLEEFLKGHDLPQTNREVYVHLHCHEQSLIGPDPTMELLSRIAKPRLLESSCCGLAGSFGYEKEHYDFSMAIGERHLFPQIRSLPPHIPLISNGFSCRCQIEHACAHRPLHLAEFLLQK